MNSLSSLPPELDEVEFEHDEDASDDEYDFDTKHPQWSPKQEDSGGKEEKEFKIKEEITSFKKDCQTSSGRFDYTGLYKKNEGNFVCCKCKASFRSSRGVYYHLKETTCGFGTKDVTVQKKDYSGMYCKKGSEMVCNTCTAIFQNLSGMHRHLLKTTCGFGEEQALVMREGDLTTKKESGNSEVFNCELCNFTGLSEGSLKQHMPKHQRQAGYKCLDCEEIFRSKKALCDHSVQLHEGMKCTDCDRRFKSCISISAHHNVEHKGKCWPCEVCGFKCKAKAQLRTHMNIHLGLKPHVCDQCGAAFADPSALNTHIKRLHDSGIIRQPTACPICGKILERYFRITYYSI